MNKCAVRTKIGETLETNAKFRLVLLLLILGFLSLVMIHFYYPDGCLISGYDTRFHLNRFIALNEAIESHNYPIYINFSILNHYGYATNLFYPDLMLLPFTFLIKPLGIITAYKWMLFVTSIICGLITYYSLIFVSKNYVFALISSVLYTFSMYHLTDMGMRGALGEYFSFMFVPLIVWGGYEIVYGNYKKRWYVLSLGFTCLILTHLISAVLTFLLLLIFLLICFKKFFREPKRLLFLFLAAIVTILFSSYFLLPLLEQMASNTFYYNTNPFVRSLAEKAVPFRWVVWGMFSGLTDQQARIPNVGFLLILPLFARLFIKENSRSLKFADIALVVGLLLLVMCSSAFPWKIFPFNQFTIMQFPWRLLEFATLLFACAGGVYLSVLIAKTKRLFIVIGLICLGSGLMIVTQGSVFQGWDGMHLTNHNCNEQIKNAVANGEYIPSSVPSQQYILSRGDLIVTSDSLSSTSNLERGYNKLAFDITTQHTSAILPLLYYKGYEAKLNRNRIELNQSKDGLVQVHLPSSGHVIVSYTGTLIQQVSVLISLLSVIGFCFYICYPRFRIYFQKKNGETV